MAARTLVAPVSFGLGDLVVSLPPIQAIIAADAPVWLVARAPSQRLLAERIQGLAGVVDEDTLACGRGDRLVDLRDHSLQRDVWWGSPAFEAEFGELTINDILSIICADFGIHADFTRPRPLATNAWRGLDATVLLVHETNGADKRWPAERWKKLAGLLLANGHQVAQLVKGDRPSPLDTVGIPAVVAPTPGEAVDALSGCAGVVGIDTGLTHIAVQQGVPTVTICRRSSVYVRLWAHSRALRGGPCTEACLRAEARYAYNDRVSLRDFQPPSRSCPSGSPCVAGIRPEDAAGLLQGLL